MFSLLNIPLIIGLVNFKNAIKKPSWVLHNSNKWLISLLQVHQNE
jgi:hypothetical protein